MGSADNVLTVPGPITVDTATMVSLYHPKYGQSQAKDHQLPKALSVQCWPSGHAIDSEEAIDFTELKNVDCLIEKFPLAKANDAFSTYFIHRKGLNHLAN